MNKHTLDRSPDPATVLDLVGRSPRRLSRRNPPPLEKKKGRMILEDHRALLAIRPQASPRLATAAACSDVNLRRARQTREWVVHCISKRRRKWDEGRVAYLPVAGNGRTHL